MALKIANLARSKLAVPVSKDGNAVAGTDRARRPVPCALIRGLVPGGAGKRGRQD